MEVVAPENFNKLNPYTITIAQFHYHLSDESDQDASITSTHICSIIKFWLKNK